MTNVTVPRVDLNRFHEQGYLVVEDVLDVPAVLDPIVAEYAGLLDEWVETWCAQGKLTSAYADLPFADRLAHVLNETGSEGYQALDISLPFGGVTEETPIHHGPAVFAMLTDRHLLDTIEQFIGPEILSNPIQHVRIKPPQRLLPEAFRYSLVGQSDWHQDQGVALPEVDATEMLTVWIPVTDATEENGCLCVVPRSNHGGLVTHCPGKTEERKTLHIPDELRGHDVTVVPVKRGSVLFLDRRTMHASLRNESNGLRWSFDLRYQPIGQPTGRPIFPSLIVRSRDNPASAVTDWRVWRDAWRATRTHLAENPPTGSTNRWVGDEFVCA